MDCRLNSTLKYSFIFIFILGGLFPTLAQFDTKFWMPPIWEDGIASQNNPSELFITTPYPDPVAVHIQTPDGITFVLDTTVMSGAPLQVPLSTTLGQTNMANTVMSDNGFYVVSSKPIQCVHKVAGQLNQTLVTLKGTNGLGTDFWCGSQVRNENGTYGPDEHHFISVQAQTNNTQITFETPFAMWSATGPLPNPLTITLNAGESYLIRGDGPLEHVAGAHVTSTEEITVISGSTHTRILGGNAADGGADQLVPVDLMGTGFIVVKGDNTNPFDYAIIVATEDNTQVFVDGGATPVATLNAG
ncbi:MAG: hypothetical protein HKN32_06930, partial [Flavobacteriales bacterium]|nr:hypothetical protein [Flavobacteriales bacterium]